MATKISDIPALKNLPEAAIFEISPLFKAKKYLPEEVILTFADQLSHFYLITGGTAEVFAEDSNVKLAVLESGACIGEMSLTDESATASATVKAGPDGLAVLVCSLADFGQTISNNQEYALNFYHGIAQVLSDRLRNTNRAISAYASNVRKEIEDFFKEHNVSGKMNSVQDSLELMGSDVMQSIFEACKALDQVKSEDPNLIKAKALLEDASIVKLQKIDIIAQKISMTIQYFDKIAAISTGDKINIEGDKKLFERFQD